VTNCDTLAHSIAEKILLLGIKQKYDIDVVTALIKLVAGKTESVFEKIALDRLEPGMVLANGLGNLARYIIRACFER